MSLAQTSFDRRRAAVFAAGFCSFLDLYTTQALLPDLAAEFHAGKAAVGLTVSAATLGVAMAAPLVGWLAQVWGRKRVIVAGAVLMALPTALAAISGSVEELVFWRFLQGLALPAVFAVANAHVNEEWPAAQAPGLIGIHMAGMVAGGFVGRTLAALVADVAGWRSAFPPLALLNLLGALVLALWLPADSTPSRRRKDAASGSVLREPRLLATCVVGAGLLFSMTATFTYVGFKLAAPPLSLSTSLLGGIFVIYLLGMPAALASGGLLKRFGRRRLMTAAILLNVAGLGLTLSGALAAILAGLTLFAAGTFIAQPLSVGYAGSAFPQARSVAVGLYVGSYYVGGSLGGVVPAAVWPSFGWPGAVAVVVAVQLAALALAMAAWWEAGKGYFSTPRSAPVRSLMASTRAVLADSQSLNSAITSGCETLDRA